MTKKVTKHIMTDEERYPYKCMLVSSGETFYSSDIDYDKCAVWQSKGKYTNQGMWHRFETVIFQKNLEFIDLIKR
jgi:hypothetical protein